MSLKIYLLGTAYIEHTGAVVSVDTRKATALLAYLVVTGTRQSRDTLATFLWEENDEQGAKAALRRTLSTLNKALDTPYLVIERQAVTFEHGDGIWIDIDEFDGALNTVEAHNCDPQARCDNCVQHLQIACNLYRDHFMAGFSLRDSIAFDNWQMTQSEYYLRRLNWAISELVQALAERQLYDDAIEYAVRWLELDPLHEATHRMLMQLYAWKGDRSSALQQYRACVRILEKELGVPPLEETSALYQIIQSSDLTQIQAQQTPVPAIPSTTHASPRLPFAGRDGVLLRLGDMLEKAKHQRQLCVIEGEQGIGKTRLLDEFVNQSIRYVLVKCYENEATLPYSLVVNLLRQLMTSLKADVQAIVAGMMPYHVTEVARLLPDILLLRDVSPVDDHLDSEMARIRLFDSVTEFIQRCLENSSIAVVAIDDIHWADDASGRLLSYVFRRITELPILILMSWVSDYILPQHPLMQVLMQEQRNGNAHNIQLERLTHQEVESLVAIATPTRETSQLANRLYSETEGLPFFINEYLSLITHRDADAQAEWDLPSGVRDLLRFRLGSINDLDRQLLTTAAVIGRSFSFDLLQAVSGRSEEEIIIGLDSLLAQRLITELPIQDDDTAQFQYDFYHGKLRTVMYQELSFARQRLLHRRVAQHLSDDLRQEASPALLGQIAHHYEQAREDDQSAQYYFAAGQSAQQLYAHSEALTYYAHALALGYQNSAPIHYGIGQILTFQGRYGDAISRFETAAAQAEGLLIARIEHRIAQVNHRMGEWELAEQHYRMALAMVQESQQAIAARILADWCLTAHRRGDQQHAQQLAQDSLVYATESGDLSALTQVYNILGILSRDIGEYSPAIRYLEQSMELARQTHNLGARLAALNNLALVYLVNNAVQDALEMAQDALVLCEQYGDRHLEAALHSNLGDILHEMGRTSDAEEHQKISASILADIDTVEGITRPEIWKLVEW